MALPIEIKIKYFTDITPLEQTSIGNWIDLRAAQDMDIKKGERTYIPLGIAMELPKGYEAHILPRSSTEKNFKILQTNSMGIVDTSYCGDNDQWMMRVMALEDTHINKNDRVCQFRIVESQPTLTFISVDHLTGKDRGGFGSTGKN